jgi:hypothetical protein
MSLIDPGRVGPGRPLFVGRDGTPQDRAWDATRPEALLPGAFNPVHAGHWALAQAAAELLGRPVAFELSLLNVDKPELAATEVRGRLSQFAGQAPVWLTRAPHFIDKAQLFAGAVFVVGADTALRLVEPRYYGDDRVLMLDALHQIGSLGCRFLVACRLDRAGRALSLSDISVPAGCGHLFAAISEDRFRLDVSSTELRQR